MKLARLLLVAFLEMTGSAWAFDLGPQRPPLNDVVEPEAPWVEEEVPPPAFPQDSNLMPFYVSELTTHRFFIDGSTLSVGKDGIVRYVLIVRTGGGATNITYEGIKCDLREFKIYASGRHDGTWSVTRKPVWRPITNMPMNRQHAALSRDFFCPGGVRISSLEEGLNALRLGKHPDAP